MEQVSKIIDKLAYFFASIGAILVVLMMLLVLFEVFMRYVIGNPPVIADEFASYMMVALAFLGSAYCFKGKGHVRIDLLPLRLSTKPGNWLRLITLILLFGFTIILVTGSFDFIAYTLQIGARAPTHFRTPLLYPQLALPIGFVMLSLAVLMAIYKAIKTIRAGGRIEDEIK